MKISIIICTRNRHQLLKKAIESVLQQDLTCVDDYELIIVDNNSTDSTKQVVQNLSQINTNIKYFFENKKGLSNARNHGVQQSTGDVIVFTDDDVIIDKSWLKEMVTCFKKYDCDCVGGRVLPTFDKDVPGWVKDPNNKLIGAVVMYDYGEQVKKFDNSMYPFIGANVAFKRNVFTDVGLYRTDLGAGTLLQGEDTDFIRRLIKNQKSLYYCGRAFIFHPFDKTRLHLLNFAKWNISCGRYNARHEHENNLNCPYILGFPRYLLKGILFDFFKLMLSLVNKPSFFTNWKNLFIKIGMIKEYRSLLKKNSTKLYYLVNIIYPLIYSVSELHICLKSA